MTCTGGPVWLLVLFSIASLTAGVSSASSSRLLLQQKPFPFCRCSDYSCSSSPYKLVTTSVPAETGTNVTITVVANEQADSSSSCYGSLSESLQRIAILTKPACASSWRNVLVNGAVVQPAPLFKVYGDLAELKISLLRPLEYSAAIGSTFVFSLSGDCPDILSFVPNNTIAYSVGESTGNRCCPVCTAPIPAPPSCEACIYVNPATQTTCDLLVDAINANPSVSAIVQTSLNFSCAGPVAGTGNTTYKACATGDVAVVNKYIQDWKESDLQTPGLYGQLLIAYTESCGATIRADTSCGESYPESRPLCGAARSPPPPAADRDSGWDFRTTAGIRSKRQANDKLKRQGGLGYNADGAEAGGGNKLKALWADWCITFNIDCDDKDGYKNFKSNMKKVQDVNDDLEVLWWATGNQFSHLDESTFQSSYTGAILEQAPVPRPDVTGVIIDIPPFPPFASATSSPPPPSPRPPPPPPSNTCVLLDSNSRAILPNPAVATCSACYNACYNNNYCFFYSWNNGPAASYSSLAPCTNPSPPSPRPPPPRPPAPPTVAGINWVARGMVTPVRNQGSCGSCWAYTTASLVESLYIMSGYGNNSTLNLSEQQLVSCYSSPGCSGGSVPVAINYLLTTPLNKESLWPYTGTNGVCNTALIASSTSGNSVRLSGGFRTVSPVNNQAAIIQALNSGPASIYFMVDASFQNYAGGVFSSATCTTSINHAMVAVGWGYDVASNKNYFLIRNSWGSWGESGYVRVAMTGDGPGMCGMYQYTYQVYGSFTGAILTPPFS